MEILLAEKRQLELECSVHDKQIDQAKVKYQDKIDKTQKLRAKLEVKLKDN